MTMIVKPTSAEVALVNGTPQSFGSNTGGSTQLGGTTGHSVYVRVVASVPALITRYLANTLSSGAFSNNSVAGSATVLGNTVTYFELSKNEFLGSNVASGVNAAPISVLGV
jgi:hypothetical protein